MSEPPKWTEKTNIIRVNNDTKIKPFRCGVAELDDFLVEDVYRHSQHLGMVTYVMENDCDTMAYYSLENDRLAIARVDDFWEENNDVDFKDFYRDLHSFPAVKIARFAVNIKYQRQGIGRTLIEYLIGSFTNNTNKTGCQFLLVDALELDCSRFFYDSMNFQYATMNDIGKSARLRYLCLLGYKS